VRDTHDEDYQFTVNNGVDDHIILARMHATKFAKAFKLARWRTTWIFAQQPDPSGYTFWICLGSASNCCCACADSLTLYAISQPQLALDVRPLYRLASLAIRA
jgi:hypothetical protein